MTFAIVQTPSIFPQRDDPVWSRIARTTASSLSGAAGSDAVACCSYWYAAIGLFDRYF